MKAHERDQAVKRYILDCIGEDRDGKDLPDTQAKIAWIQDTFTSEYGWRVTQVGRQAACVDWLQGLALPIAFMNADILELARAWGSLPEGATEKQEDKILANYWRFMAAKVCQLMDGYRVPKH